MRGALRGIVVEARKPSFLPECGFLSHLDCQTITRSPAVRVVLAGVVCICTLRSGVIGKSWITHRFLWGIRRKTPDIYAAQIWKEFTENQQLFCIFR